MRLLRTILLVFAAGWACDLRDKRARRGIGPGQRLQGRRRNRPDAGGGILLATIGKPESLHSAQTAKASCGASRSAAKIAESLDQLGGICAGQQLQRADRPADRGAALPAGGFRNLLARSRFSRASPPITPSEGFSLEPAEDREADSFLDHARPRRRRHLRRRTALAEAAAVLSVGAGRLQGHGQFLHALPRHRARHFRPAGGVPDHPVRGQGIGDISGDGGARLGRARLCLRRFRLLGPGHRHHAPRASRSGAPAPKSSSPRRWSSSSTPT